MMKIWYCGLDPGSALQVNFVAKKSENPGLSYFKWPKMRGFGNRSPPTPCRRDHDWQLRTTAPQSLQHCRLRSPPTPRRWDRD